MDTQKQKQIDQLMKQIPKGNNNWVLKFIRRDLSLFYDTDRCKGFEDTQLTVNDVVTIVAREFKKWEWWEDRTHYVWTAARVALMERDLLD